MEKKYLSLDTTDSINKNKLNNKRKSKCKVGVLFQDL